MKSKVAICSYLLAALLAVCQAAVPRAHAEDAPAGASASRLLQDYQTMWLNENQEQLVDRIIAADVVRHHPGSVRPPEIRGREAYKAYVAEFRKLHPDLRVELHDTIVQDGKIAYRYTASALDPRNNKRFTFTGVTVAHFGADGRITEEWVTWDTYDLMSQVGLVPPREP